MAIFLKHSINAEWLQKKLQIEAIGTPLTINCIAPVSQAIPNCLTFTTKKQEVAEHFTIIGPDEWLVPSAFVIRSKAPRLDFIRALNILNEEVGFALNEASPKIHSSVIIGQNVVIGPGVEIGAGTILYHNIVIGRGVKIGENCLIKSGTVIGEEGFGFERNAQGIPLRMLHLGAVTIGNYVEIGSLSTICRGALENTIIGDHVKIDDHCFIAHNCSVKEKTMIAAGSVLAGSVTVEPECWIAPNTTLINKTHIGHRAFIGIGAVVTRDVSDEEKVFGNPARTIPT